MELVDSRKKQLGYGEILLVYYQRTSDIEPQFKDPKAWILSMATAINAMNAEGMIIGNTFFLYKRGPNDKNNQAMVWVINADVLQNLVDNAAEFMTRLGNIGITDMVAAYRGDGLSRIARQAFNKIKSPNDGLKITKDENGMRVLHITLREDIDV